LLGWGYRLTKDPVYIERGVRHMQAQLAHGRDWTANWNRTDFQHFIYSALGSPNSSYRYLYLY